MVTQINKIEAENPTELPNIDIANFTRTKNPNDTTETSPQTNKVKTVAADISGAASTLVSENYEKLFALISLIGFIYVFSTGNLEYWSDFFRFSSFILFTIVLYAVIVSLPNIIKKNLKFEKNFSFLSNTYFYLVMILLIAVSVMLYANKQSISDKFKNIFSEKNANTTVESIPTIQQLTQ